MCFPICDVFVISVSVMTRKDVLLILRDWSLNLRQPNQGKPYSFFLKLAKMKTFLQLRL